MQRKILFIDKAHFVLEERLLAMGYHCDHATDQDKATIEEILPEYFGIIIRSRFAIDRDFIKKGTQLAFIARTGIGLEHVDLEAAEQQGVKVFNSPEGSKETVGEHAIGLLLCLLNHLPRADRQVRNGQWIREGNRGLEIGGKTVGIVGYGNTGQAFARRLQGFNARVIAYDKFRQNYGDGNAEEVTLNDIWKYSDIVSFHIPYLPENHYLVNAAYLDQFAKPIYLINTARGLILNTTDLVERLKSGKVLGAALDVLEYEETSFTKLDLDSLPAPFQYLRQAENVVLTPHIAGWSQEAKKAHAVVLADKIQQAFS